MLGYIIYCHNEPDVGPTDWLSFGLLLTSLVFPEILRLGHKLYLFSQVSGLRKKRPTLNIHLQEIEQLTKELTFVKIGKEKSDNELDKTKDLLAIARIELNEKKALLEEKDKELKILKNQLKETKKEPDASLEIKLT